jgi:hypothetical protein
MAVRSSSTTWTASVKTAVVRLRAFRGKLTGEGISGVA